MSLKINPTCFREYDIRGIAGNDLTPAFAELLGLAYTKFISGRKPDVHRKTLTVSVGWDCRLSSDYLATALIDGLRKGGVDVISLGTCPTPATYFSLFHLDLDGAIMITGSHNPSEYNGFKVCVGRTTVFGSQIQELRSIMESKLEPSEKRGNLTTHPIISSYIDWIVKHIPACKPRKIVVDAGNGTAGVVAPELLKRLGAEVIQLYCNPDGRFPNHHPDPTVLSNLEDLIISVKKTHADFGVAFDGDSDRIGLVDETGRVIFGDEIMVLLSRDILKNNPGASIISEVKSSYKLYADIAKHGGKPIMWKTGHSLIKSKMKETGALLAGEMSGHIFFADRYFGFDDAIYTAARILEIASKTAEPISSLLSDLPKTVSTPEIRVDCEETKKFKLVEETKKILASMNHKITAIDGVRIELGDSWGLLRASNTQPVLVLRFEAPDDNRLKNVRTIVESALKSAAKIIGHAPIIV